MSYTIFIANPTALIPQPGRAVNTFPSGLVRVDQTYLGLTSQAATHRAILTVGNDMPDGDSSPCIDGLKIYPEVQERRREDGFTEYIVSAYGRVNSTGKSTSIKVLYKQAFTYSKLFHVLNSANGTFPQNFTFESKITLFKNVNIEKTVAASQAIEENSLSAAGINIQLAETTVSSSNPTAENYATPDSSGTTALYFLGFSDYQITVTAGMQWVYNFSGTSISISQQKGYDLKFTAVINNPVYSNSNPLGTNSNGTMTPAGSRVQIGDLFFAPTIEENTTVRNFGSFNEMIQQFVVQ